MIRVKEVRAIDPEGNQLGVITIQDALKKAEELGLDLVEISPTAKPPVCKIMDFGKFKYEQSKKTHVMKQHQKAKALKEVKLRPYTDDHDLQFKINNLRRFLEEGNKAKVTVAFKGREMSRTELGRNVLDKITKGLEDIGKVELPPKMEGRNLVMVIIPK